MELSFAEEENLDFSDVDETDDDSCFAGEEEDEEELYDDDDYDEEYDENEDDDEEDEQMTPESMAELFAVVAQMVVDEVDGEDGSDCPCPECRSRRLLDIMNGHEDNNDDDEASLEGGSPCCICMRRKALVTLPCCGAQSELTSSTRFCASCVNQCLVNDGCPPHPAWIGCKMGECPRCKHLMVQTPDGTLQKATTTQILYYIVGLRNPNYLQLFSILFSCEYMPREVFAKQDAECLSHVCRWGLLECKNGVYSLRKPDVVRNWAVNNLCVEWENGRLRCRESRSDEEERDNAGQVLSLLGACELAAICKDLVTNKKIFLALRLANRISLLMSEFAGLLPSMSEWRTPSNTKQYRAAMLVVSTLNLYFWFCLAKALIRVMFSAGAALPALAFLHSGSHLLLSVPKKKKGGKGRLLKISHLYSAFSVLRCLWNRIPVTSLWSAAMPFILHRFPVGSLWKTTELVWPFGILGGLVWLLHSAPKLLE